MKTRFMIGFGIGLLIFIAINLLAAHLRSDCGLLAVFGRDMCADDIARAGWPLQFYEEGGFAYRHNFNALFLVVNLGIGIVLAVFAGLLMAGNKKTLSK
jgi:hypothetical protein